MTKLRAMKPLRYNSRMLQVGDEFEPMAGDVRYLTARGRTEIVTDESKRRGRPPKAKAEPQAEPHDQLEEMKVDDLRKVAEERGVDLPSGYVKHDELVEIIRKDHPSEDQGDR